MRRPKQFYGLCENCKHQKTPGFCAVSQTETNKNWYENIPGIFDRDKCLKCSRFIDKHHDGAPVYNPSYGY